MLQQAASPFHSRHRRCISPQTACKRLEIDRHWNKLIENWLVYAPRKREKLNVTSLQWKLQRIKRKINTGRSRRTTCLSPKCSVSRQYNKCILRYTVEKRCILKLDTHVRSFRCEDGMLLIKTFVVFSPTESVESVSFLLAYKTRSDI
jgi:hypothetical protein